MTEEVKDTQVIEEPKEEAQGELEAMYMQAVAFQTGLMDLCDKFNIPIGLKVGCLSYVQHLLNAHAIHEDNKAYQAEQEEKEPNDVQNEEETGE